MSILIMNLKKIFFLFLGLAVCYPMGAAKKKAPDPEEVLQQGREAFLNYDFDEAADLYDQYKALMTKAKQPFFEEFDIWESELDVASNAFERVQKIVIIDSISVKKGDFFKAYRLSPSTGEIGLAKNLSSISESGVRELAFLNERKDFLITAQPGSEGDLRLYEHYKLLDGSWESMESLSGTFEKSGDYGFPFMAADGQTLYFANNGEGSMGGYDIFVAQRDPLTGEYLQPLNLGMPFNSPYDDLMMVIDEERGLGWWATDRNSEDGKIDVYVYLIEDIRKNYPEDTENLTDYAKITNYKDTWEPGKDAEYKSRLKVIR